MMDLKMVLENKKFIVGVTGGIAAYKSCELVSKLVKSGAEVRVVMTHSALKFVSPVTFSALTGNPVSFDMFNSKENIPHIELVSDADLLAVIPATANIIGKLANGIADDLLSTMLLAANCPVFMAPAMNINMYNHPSVQSNIRELIRMGIHIIEPEEGHLACGTTGKGRLPSPESLFREIKSYFVKETDLKGFRVLITAGGTKEPIDPVRYIGNHSSGKMGYALARTAKNRGAKVTLISTVDKEIAVDQFIKAKTCIEKILYPK
jgi:phosphopantothenoylcysteine decarboxylase/phosphopantothenate--cysteine ligase